VREFVPFIIVEVEANDDAVKHADCRHKKRQEEDPKIISKKNPWRCLQRRFRIYFANATGIYGLAGLTDKVCVA
jgi:hypothetical protein